MMKVPEEGGVVMATTTTHAARSASMGDEARGEAIKRRRQRLEIANPNQLLKRMRESGEIIDADTVRNVERGEASTWKMEQVEKWLTRQEEEKGFDDPPAAEPIRLTFHGLRVGRVSVDEFIVESPVDHPDELAEAVGKLLDRFQRED